MDIFEKHINDLARRSYEKEYSEYSEFLNLDETSTLKSLSLPCPYTLYGGYEGAERCVAGFMSEEGGFPICCIEITPLNQKFADKLTHRDFLGSLMNLGINRNTLGDIIIKDNVGYLFCLNSMSGYIIDSLTKVKHTSVKCRIIEDIPEFINEAPDAEEINVPSLRVDAVTATIYRLSRNAVSQLFKSSMVFINSKLCTKEGTQLKEGDVVSVRHHGKYVFEGEVRKTKKDREIISVRIYK